MGRRAWHRRHQHARGPQRGGRGHRARSSVMHGAGVSPGRAVSPRGEMAAGALSADQGHAA